MPRKFPSRETLTPLITSINKNRSIQLVSRYIFDDIDRGCKFSDRTFNDIFDRAK